MSAFLLGAVAATGLLAVAHTGGVEGAADDLVAHAGEVLHPAAAHQHDGVLLQVVALAGDVGGDLHAAGQPDASHLAQRGVRLLRGGGVHAGAHATTLRGALERGRLALRRLRLAALADQLLDGGHEGTFPDVLKEGRFDRCRDRPEDNARGEVPNGANPGQPTVQAPEGSGTRASGVMVRFSWRRRRWSAGR